MNGGGPALLVAAPGLLGLGLFALSHRRDAMGATLAVLLGFQAVVCALVGFAALGLPRPAAAQLQAFAVLVEVVGALWVVAMAALAAVLRRRQGGSDLLEAPAVASPAASAPPAPADPLAAPASAPGAAEAVPLEEAQAGEPGPLAEPTEPV